jgi:hypothetical protein
VVGVAALLSSAGWRMRRDVSSDETERLQYSITLNFDLLTHLVGDTGFEPVAFSV